MRGVEKGVCMFSPTLIRFKELAVVNELRIPHKQLGIAIEQCSWYVVMVICIYIYIYIYIHILYTYILYTYIYIKYIHIYILNIYRRAHM